MDARIRLPQEHGRDAGHGNGDISRIEYREFQESDLGPFSGVLADFWERVNGEDLRGPSKYEIEGRKISKVEAKVYHFQYERCRIQLCIENGEIVGLLVYHLAYNCVLAVECLFVRPECERRGVGKGLLASLGKPLRKIFFQTHLNNPPSKLLQLSKNPNELHREGDLIAWELDWHQGAK